MKEKNNLNPKVKPQGFTHSYHNPPGHQVCIYNLPQKNIRSNFNATGNTFFERLTAVGNDPTQYAGITATEPAHSATLSAPLSSYFFNPVSNETRSCESYTSPDFKTKAFGFSD